MEALLELEKTRDVWLKLVDNLEEDLLKAADENATDIAGLLFS